MHKFIFSYEGTELMIPVAAVNIDAAKAKLVSLFMQWSGELGSVGTPAQESTLSPIQPHKQEDMPMPAVSHMALELRIEDLMKEIVGTGLRDAKRTVEATVRDWTGFKMEASSYAAIIEVLEKIKRDGQ